MNPWGYQEKNINAVIDFFKHGGKSVLLQQPTGTGKSLVAAEIVTRFFTAGKPVYFITHSRALLWQFHEHLDKVGLRHGVVAPGYPTLRMRIQVISAGSLKNRAQYLDEPSLVIFEEAHHSTASTFTNILDLWPNALLFGMTATPNRPSGEPLSMYQDIILSPPIRWFIDNYHLSDYKYYIPHEFDTSGIKRTAGDMNSKQLEEAAERDKSRVKQIVESYRKYAEGLPGISFAISIADTVKIAENFQRNGLNMHPLHSKMDGSLKDCLERANRGEINLIGSCDMIGEGVDVKRLECMLDGRPTDSHVIQIQHWGRVLRAMFAPGYDLSTLEGRKAAMEASGKGDAIILDFSSNYLRHGLPDDPREWSLSGKPKKEEAKYKRCPNCQMPILRHLMTCPECQYVFPATEGMERQIEEYDGEMVDIKSLGRLEFSRLTSDIAIKAQTFAQAIDVAVKSGYSKREAWYIWTRIFKKPVA